MTDINFYVSKQEGLENRMAIVFRLIKLGLKHKYKIYIHTDSESTSAKLDDYLWSNENNSFIPHSIISNNHSLNDEINISHDFEPLNNCDYLINLSNKRPDFFSRFLKVAEILDTRDEILTAGRKRYSFYRDRGYTLGYHQL